MRKDVEPTRLIDFDAWGSWLAQKVRGGRKADKGNRDVPPLQTEYGAVRHHPYEYLWRLSEHKLLEALTDHVDTRPGPTGGPAWAVLRLLEPARGQLLTPSTRSRVAQELEFSLKHQIEPSRVLGFLYEVGSQAMIIAARNRKSTPEAVRRYRIS